MPAKIHIITFLLNVFLFSDFGVHAQDPLNAHFFLHTGNLNPSLAGTAGQQRYFANYRNQYPALRQVYVTYTGGFDIPLPAAGGGAGMSVVNDVLAKGGLNTFSADFFYAYHLTAGRHLKLCGGLQFSVINRHLNSLLISDNDFQEMIPARSAFLMDVSTGISVFWKNNLTGGIAVHHAGNKVLSGSENIYVPPKITTHASYFYPYGEGHSLLSSFIFQYQQHLSQLTWGALYLYKNFGAGLWARHNEAFLFSALIMGLHYEQSIYSVYYSYEFSVKPTSYLLNFGSHEVTFLIKFKYKDLRKKKPRAIKCPDI